MDKTKKLVLCALFTALSLVLLYVPFLRFPIFPAAAFLEYDAMDVPILLGTLLLGGKSGLLITLISSLIQGITVSSSSGLYGIIMHFISSGTFCVATGLMFKKGRGKKRLIFALIFGALAMTFIMVPANLLITPLFMGVERSAVAGMLVPIIIPFNAIKAGINALVAFLIYPLLCKAVKF